MQYKTIYSFAKKITEITNQSFNGMQTTIRRHIQDWEDAGIIPEIDTIINKNNKQDSPSCRGEI